MVRNSNYINEQVLEAALHIKPIRYKRMEAEPIIRQWYQYQLPTLSHLIHYVANKQFKRKKHRLILYLPAQVTYQTIKMLFAKIFSLSLAGLVAAQPVAEPAVAGVAAEHLVERQCLPSGSGCDGPDSQCITGATCKINSKGNWECYWC